MCKKIEKYLFGDQFDQKEPNTYFENKLWSILDRFVNGNSFMKNDIPPEYLKQIKILRDCKPYYEELLTPSKCPLYRGTVVSNLPKNKPIKELEHDIAPDHGLYVFKLKYTPKKEIQSWTTDFETACNFAGVEDYNDFETAFEEEQAIPTVLQVDKVDNSFFFGNPKLTSKIFKGFMDESEVFRIGNAITCKAYIAKINFI